LHQHDRRQEYRERSWPLAPPRAAIAIAIAIASTIALCSIDAYVLPLYIVETIVATRHAALLRLMRRRV
jgi:hypothetical protein